MTTDWLYNSRTVLKLQVRYGMAFHILVLLHKTIPACIATLLYQYFTFIIPNSYVLCQSDMLSVEVHSVLLDQQDKA